MSTKPGQLHANGWDIEYNDLRPVADLIRELQRCISQWLDNPEAWTRKPEDDREAQEAINLIRRRVFEGVGPLAERRLISAQDMSGKRPSPSRARDPAFAGPM